jgi:probable F420-dependent oxidoreductase
MSTRPFRFGIVSALAPTADDWTTTARRAEDLGYDTLLTPDTLRTFSPFPAIAAAAAVTRTLRFGTFVLNTPLHAPAATALNTMTLDMLTNGRFELGLGAGRPGAEAEAERLGMPWGSPGERVTHLADTIRTVKETLRTAAASTGGGPSQLRPVQQPRPPILVAGAGRRLLRIAAEEADIIGLGVGPEGTEYDLAAKVGQLRDIAGDRFASLELSMNIAAIGDDLPAWMGPMLGGADPKELAARGSIALLSGSTAEMVDTLERRRESLGISYISVNAMFMDQLAPVVHKLAGR